MRVGTMLAGLTVALVLSAAYAAQTDVRKIDTSGFDLGDVREERLEKPMVITNADELYDAFSDEMAFAIISQQVDFNSEFLLYFTWIGSGQDTLKAITASNSTRGELTFVYTSGMTLDLSPHHHLFAVPKESSWRVEITAPGVIR